MDQKYYDLYYSNWNYVLYDDDNKDYMNKQMQDAVEEKENQ